jgi:hypothetical protein
MGLEENRLLSRRRDQPLPSGDPIFVEVKGIAEQILSTEPMPSVRRGEFC